MATVKAIARRAVEGLGPGDLAGVMTTSGRLGGQTELTRDKSRLMAAIGRFMPQGGHDLPAIASGPPSNGKRRICGKHRRPPNVIRNGWIECRGAGALDDHAPAKRRAPHQPGLSGQADEIMRNPRIGDAYESIREFLLTAQRSNVAVYTVDPCGLEADPGCTRDSRQNLRTIAEMTGGFAVVNTNAPEAGVDRMLAENGSYYLIGYNSPARPNDGKHHRITVRTRVPDVELRAREGYDSPGKAPKQSVATPLDTLTRSVIQTRGLTMRVVAIPAPLPTEPSTTVIVGIELPTNAAARARRIEFAVVAIDQEGKTRARAQFSTDFTNSEKTASPWTRTGSRIDLPPGEYQLRVAAVGADASTGSVFLDVSVPTFAAELAVGGLSLGAPSSTAVTSADRLRGVLALVPLATNELARGTAVSGQLPIKVSSGVASRPLTIAATLVHADQTTVPLDRTEATARGLCDWRRQSVSSGASGVTLRRQLSPDRRKHVGPDGRDARTPVLCLVATMNLGSRLLENDRGKAAIERTGRHAR